MEEEDEKCRNAKEDPTTSTREFDDSKGVSVVHGRVELQLKENSDAVGGSENEVEINDGQSEGLDSVVTVEEDSFEQVSLDQDNGRLFNIGYEAGAHDRSWGHKGEDEIFPAIETRHDRSISSPGPEIQVDFGIKHSNSTASLDVYYYGDLGISPMGSPPKPKAKASMPNVSPELLHLVDSAIMGKPESIDKLKNMVSGAESFGNGEEAESVAFLIVDSLLATMGGVECFEEDEDNNPPSVMLNSRAAIVAGDLIPWLPWDGDSKEYMSPRTRMVRGLLAILRACTRNRAMCSSAGLLGVLLGSAEKIFCQDIETSEKLKWDGTPLCYCIQYLAGHSLSVVDLRRWFEVITKILTTKWAARLMLSLEKAMAGKESRGPACTFEFDGESSGLLGSGESRWPFTNGYAFATWIYIESFADTLNTATAAAAIAAAAAAKSGKSSAMSAAAAASALAGEGTAHMPRLFSFLSADNQGIEAYFHAQFLVIESGSGKGRKASLHFTYAFKPQCWYFIGLEHSYKQGLVGKAESELRLYIDGKLYECRPFEFPRISKPLAFCCIGTNPPPTIAGLQRRRRQCPLFAEMGPVYIFKEPIGPERMTRLASRGGDVLPSFGHGAGLPWLASNDHIQKIAEESSLLDAEIGGQIHLLYHPLLLNGRFCPDASPSGAAGMLRRPAEVLGQVHVATRMRPAEALWAFAYGGPMCLLPLAISSVHKDSLEPQLGNISLSSATAALAAPIFRIIAMAVQHPGNNEELSRTRGPELFSRILKYLLNSLSSLHAVQHDGVGDEELVAAVVTLCQSQKNNHALKVQLFSTLLLDLKIWSLCSYGLQKKLLSSLADMVFTESAVMQDAKAIQMLLDGCRRCYWVIREKDSLDTFSLDKDARPVGEVNALVDELLVVIELLIGATPPASATSEVHRLIGFLVECVQPNQVARVLHLIYRLVVQPNTTKAQTFAEAFISSGGIESLLVLLQKEAKAGDHDVLESMTPNDGVLSGKDTELHSEAGNLERSQDENAGLKVENNIQEKNVEPLPLNTERSSSAMSGQMYIERMSSVSDTTFIKNLGGISLSISADNARNNVHNIDKSDGVVVAIIGLVGALLAHGHLKIGSQAPSDLTSSFSNFGLHDRNSTMFEDRVALVLFALQKVFQAAPNRLMTSNVYTALLGASINASSTEDGLNFYDCGHRFEHSQLLLVLLHSLPHASVDLQNRALQDLLFLACSHPENRSSLTSMEEWPEWILEILISNYERGASKQSSSASFTDIEDLIHSFLIIMLEHSMRQKDGWKDIEATIHCAEWLSMVGGSSTGDQRTRREESLPIFKRRLLGGLLDFSARELQAQTQVIAAAAAGVAAEGLSPQDAKVEAQNAAQLSVALVENAIVILMLVEDHLRLRSKQSWAAQMKDVAPSPLSLAAPSSCYANQSLPTVGESEAVVDIRSSIDSGVPLDVLASMADANGRISASVMERLTAAAAAEPYESVSCAFVSYGSCTMDIAEGWKYRSRLWYGVGLPPKSDEFGGGGSGWESWKSALEKDASGNWIELPLVKKSMAMLQALLLDESGLGGGLGIGGGSGTGMGGMAALYQLLDSDQPFLCMLRMVLLSMREEDNGEDSMFIRNVSAGDEMSDGLHQQAGKPVSLEDCARARQPRSALLWSVLSPVLNMPVSDSKRQRVLVTSCVLYSEVWHAVSRDRKPLRKQYLEAVLPPYVAILRRWRPLLAGMFELASSDGLNPLAVEDRALAADALPLEAAIAMISPAWAAAFASPPASMALAMIAAGAAGNETPAPVPSAPVTSASAPLRRDSMVPERKTNKLHTFSSFQKPSEASSTSTPLPKDRASAKAAALAAARDLERNAKIGSGRGLSAVAMATSAQRRNAGDAERVKRWTTAEAMGVAWMECLQPVDTKSVYGKDFNALSYKFIAVLVASFAFARNLQRSEVDRRSQVDLIARHRLCTGYRAWRKLIHRLIELKCLFGPFRDISNSSRVFWKLDFMESSSRMRRILRIDYVGSDHVGAAANFEDQGGIKLNQENVISSSNAPILAADAISMELVKEDDDEQSEIENSDAGVSISLEQDGDNRARVAETGDHALQESVDTSGNQSASAKDLASTLSPVALGYVPSEIDERILFELPSSMVRPLRVVRGTFQVTTRRINFIVDNTEVNEESTSELRDREKDRSWSISALHQIYSRRYLLRRSALELFMVDGSNFFFDFGSTEGRTNAYRSIVQARPPHLNNIYLATQRPEQLLKRTQLMERWARWEISNFEYLMALNTLAGRSYNDITQYPVFPWILSDYTSQSLDLGNPSSYRDLSKPVGALNPARLEKFKERYSSFDDPVIPKFHYGSHYSSAGTVLYYLVRVEPFTTLSIQLQGGKFDHADRMFSDIAATWNGVVEDMSDVKELVPELFYLPELLTNENSIDFGTTQLGEKLDSVKLPPWAESPVDFIRKHKMALESEHVSAHLHEWVDLIFGYKQRGKEAIASNNVFFYITYEGTVDIDKISDPEQQRSTQDQIAYFGQTPSQLLTVPHMKKMPLADVLHLQTIFRNPKEVKPYIVPSSDRCNLPASAIHASSDNVIIVDMNAPAAHVALHNWQPNTPDGQGTPFLFQHGKTTAGAAAASFMRMFKVPTGSGDGCQFPQALAFAASGIRSSAIVAITQNKEIITGGHADNSIKLLSSDGAKTLEVAIGHCAPVTCLALSPDSGYLVTGSRDTTVIVWRIHKTTVSHTGSISEPSSASGTPSARSSSLANILADKSRRHLIEGPLHVLRGHHNEILACSVSSDVGVVVSCSDSSDVLLHSVRKGRLIKRLAGVEAHAVALSSEGVVMTWNKSQHTLCTFTLNGVPIARAELPISGSIGCIEISVDGRNALIGMNSDSGSNGGYNNSQFFSMTDDSDAESEQADTNKWDIPSPSVCFIDVHTLKLFHVLKLKRGQEITSLALNKDNTNLLVSTADKQLIIFTDPALSVKVVDHMLKLGWEGDGLSPLIKSKS